MVLFFCELEQLFCYCYRMSEFLTDCAQRIIVLGIVHRRIMNRYNILASSIIGPILTYWANSNILVPQISQLPAVARHAPTQNSRHQAQRVLPHPLRVCLGVSYDEGASAAAAGEEGQPPRAKQDQGQDDH